jgi:molecular chaperone GrpE (heat shock protein)
MEEKIHNLQKENKLLKLQLLHLSEDIELMYERMEELEKKLKEKRIKNPYMKIMSPER